MCPVLVKLRVNATDEDGQWLMMIGFPMPRQKMIATHIHDDTGKTAPGRPEAIAAGLHGRMGVGKGVYFAVKKYGSTQLWGVQGELPSLDEVAEKMAHQGIMVKFGQVKVGKVIQLRDR